MFGAADAIDKNLDGDPHGTRKERILFLLNHWPDFYETMGKTDPALSAAAGDALKLMPGMSRHPSVVELARVLEVVQRQCPRSWSHLENYYNAPWKTMVVAVKRKTKKGKTETIMRPERIRQVPRWVRMRKVVNCVNLLIVPGYQGEPFMPKQLLERTDEDDKKPNKLAA